MDSKDFVMFIMVVFLPISWAVIPDCDLGFIVEHTSDGPMCVRCPNDTFTPVKNGDRCEICTRVYHRDPYVKVVSPCRSDRDTVLRCRLSNYFLDPSPAHKTCRPCSRCGGAAKPFVGQECHGTKNTVCCEKEGMVVRDGVCVERDFCSVKERLIHRGGVNGMHTSCEQCPANFTNYESRHLKKSCKAPCMDIINIANSNDPEIIERHFTCKEYEVELGRSCFKRENILCRSISHPTNTDHTIDTFNKRTSQVPDKQNEHPGEDPEYFNQEEFSKSFHNTDWGLGATITASIVAAGIFTLIFGVLIYRRCKKSGRNERRQRFEESETGYSKLSRDRNRQHEAKILNLQNLRASIAADHKQSPPVDLCE